MKTLNRRMVLKRMGMTMALPWLEVMGESKATTVKRFIGIDLCLGLYPDSFFPKEAGKNYKLSPYLEKLQNNKDNITSILWSKLSTSQWRTL